MPKRRPSGLVLAAMTDAADRQRALDEVCRRALRGFVGRDVTPTLLAEAETVLRSELDAAVRAGKYVLPDGLALDRVVLGTDMRIKVYFARTNPAFAIVNQPSTSEADRINTIMDELEDEDER